MASRRRSRSRGRDSGDFGSLVLKVLVYGVLLAAFSILSLPPIVDRVNGATSSSGECRLLRVVDADRFSLSCDVVGRQTAQLLGADAPSSTGVGCRAEFWAGYRAKWAARRFVWAAGDLDIRLDGFGWRDRTLMVVQSDGEGLASYLRQAGVALQDDGYAVTGWCGGRLEELGADGTAFQTVTGEGRNG